MTQVKFYYVGKNSIKWNSAAKCFTADGDQLPFATSYRLINPASKKSMVFDFVKSTGSEWDADTLWVYKSDEGIYFITSNGSDANIQTRADNYLKHKLKN